jgi:hypothetical protein
VRRPMKVQRIEKIQDIRRALHPKAVTTRPSRDGELEHKRQVEAKAHPGTRSFLVTG